MSSVYKDRVIHVNINELDNPAPILEENVRVISIQQLSLNKSLKLFGERRERTVTKELMQLYDMNTYYPVDPETLYDEDNERTLASLMFLVEKHSEEINARACANGSTQ